MDPILIDLPVPIKTQRLLLRPPQIGDGAILNAAVLESFENLRYTMPWAKTKPSLEESEIFVRQAAANWILKKNEEPYLPLFVFDNKNNFLGSAGFHHINWDVPCLEIGYWIRHQYIGQGLMTEAVNALVQYAIKQLGAKRIAITCDENNVRSKKIPERLGFEKEGTLKNNRMNLSTNKVSNTLIFAKHDLDNLSVLDVSWGGR